jgi:nicotinate-nucleotide adenylyltransferase
MHVGIFGGSFDPFHSGHLTLIRSALSAGRLDHLVVIPAGSPPHKDSTRMTPAAHRYFMTAAALAGEPGVSVSDAEMSREGPTYTIDTLRSLRGRFGPDATLYLVVGADIVFDIRSWRFPDQVFAESVLYLAMRPGFRRADVEARADELRVQFGARIEVFDADTPDVSATALREALRTGGDLRDRLPAPVLSYIRKHALYPDANPLDAVPDETMDRLAGFERRLFTALGPSRLRHSLCCMTETVRLGLQNGVDPAKAALAGLLHDCAKSLPPEAEQEYARRMSPPLDEMTLDSHELLHAPLCARIAEETFGISDPEILHAIRYHTTGCPGMNTLDKVLFLADKIEPTRSFPSVEDLRAAADDLDGAVLALLKFTEDYLRDKEKHLHPDSTAARRWLEEGMADRVGGIAGTERKENT